MRGFEVVNDNVCNCENRFVKLASKGRVATLPWVALLTYPRVTDEFKGHSLLEASRQADPARVKKFLSGDSVNFKHPHSGDTPLVSGAALAIPPAQNTTISAPRLH